MSINSNLKNWILPNQKISRCERETDILINHEMKANDLSPKNCPEAACWPAENTCYKETFSTMTMQCSKTSVMLIYVMPFNISN